MKLGKGICSVAAAPCRLCCTYVMGRSCSKSGAKTASASQSDEQRHMGLREMQLGQEGLMTATEEGSHRSMLSQKSIGGRTSGHGTIRGSGRWMYFLVLWLVGGLAAPLSGSLFTQTNVPKGNARAFLLYLSSSVPRAPWLHSFRLLPTTSPLSPSHSSRTTPLSNTITLDEQHHTRSLSPSADRYHTLLLESEILFSISVPT